MGFKKDSGTFYEGLLMYLVFVLPEVLLLFNLPLNSALVKFIIDTNIDSFMDSISSPICIFTTSAILVAFVARYIKCMLINSDNILLKSHGKWLMRTFEVYALSLISYSCMIYTIIKIVTKYPNYLLICEALTIILTIVMAFITISFILREVIGFMCFLKIEEPSLRNFKKIQTTF